MSKANDINRQLRRDILRVYREVAPHCWYQRDAWEKTVMHPAPRFYVTPKQAYQKVLPMLDGDFSEIDCMNPRRQRLYACLYQRVLEASEQVQFAGKSLWFMMPFIVSQPAPEFFLSTEQLRQIFREETKKSRKTVKQHGSK